MKRYSRLIVAFGVGVAVIAATTASILFLETWLPANGFSVPKKVFLIASISALSAAMATGAKICLKEARRIEAGKSS